MYDSKYRKYRYNSKFELPEKIKRKIEIFWDEAKKQTPDLWNGELMCVSSCERIGNKIEIICKKSNYSHYLYDERIGLPKEYACSSLVAGCLLETSDHYYIVGELAGNTSFPHCMQISGGSVDNDDIVNGKIDIFSTIEREVKEELNINLQNKNQVKEYEIKYMSLPNDKAHTYILFAKSLLKMSKLEMEQYYQQYLQELKETNSEIEFEKIHFIKKGEITKQLNEFGNPKREYLLNLLEMDGKYIKKYLDIDKKL